MNTPSSEERRRLLRGARRLLAVACNVSSLAIETESRSASLATATSLVAPHGPPIADRAFEAAGWSGQRVPPPLVVNSDGFSLHAATRTGKGSARSWRNSAAM